jgi:hypothetical protein
MPGPAFAPLAAMARARRVGSALVLNGGCLFLLAAGTAFISEDMRRHLVNLLSGDGSTELAFVIGPAEHLIRQCVATFGDYQSHGMMVAFGAAALVLVGFLIRT